MARRLDPFGFFQHLRDISRQADEAQNIPSFLPKFQPEIERAVLDIDKWPWEVTVAKTSDGQLVGRGTHLGGTDDETGIIDWRPISELIDFLTTRTTELEREITGKYQQEKAELEERFREEITIVNNGKTIIYQVKTLR